MLRAYLKSIADAIRTKLGITSSINAQEFPNKVNEVYDKGRTDECSKVSDAIRDVVFAPNLFDKDNYEVYTHWGASGIEATDTGLQWTNNNSGAGYILLKFGLAKDYAGKILTLQTKHFYSGYTGLALYRADRTEIIEARTEFTVQQENGTYIDRIHLADSGYTDEIICIRFYYSVKGTIVFDEIMVHDHYEAIQPYVPYGYKPTINIQDYPAKISEMYKKGINDCKIEAMRMAQHYGSRTNYENAFCSAREYGYWTDTTFYPQYDIRGTNFYQAFSGFGYSLYTKQSLDLSERLEECGVVLDTSNATTLRSCFGNSTIVRVPTLDCRNCENENGLNTVFGFCDVKTVDKMIVKRTQKFANTFRNTPLVNITFEGEIGQNIAFTSPNLTVDSVKSVMLHLVDYSTDTENKGKYTLTLNDSTKTAMSNLGAIPEFNNKTYDAYLADIGWCL